MSVPPDWRRRRGHAQKGRARENEAVPGGGVWRDDNGVSGERHGGVRRHLREVRKKKVLLFTELRVKKKVLLFTELRVKKKVLLFTELRVKKKVLLLVGGKGRVGL